MEISIENEQGSTHKGGDPKRTMQKVNRIKMMP